jgi:hypothetical protein
MPSMKKHLLFAIILFCLKANCLNAGEADTCFCLNEGVCRVDEVGASHCDCSSDTIGLICEESASSLSKLDAPANITE